MPKGAFKKFFLLHKNHVIALTVCFSPVQNNSQGWVRGLVVEFVPSIDKALGPAPPLKKKEQLFFVMVDFSQFLAPRNHFILASGPFWRLLVVRDAYFAQFLYD